MSSEDDTQVVDEQHEIDAEEEVENSEEEETTDSDNNDSTLPDDVEVLRREIAKLRKENANRRTKNRQIEQDAKKWQEHVDSQKTELEKIQDQLNRVGEENKNLKLEKTQRDLAKEYGVDEDLTEFIVGADLDEMVAKAKKLADKTTSPKKTTTADDLRAGRRSGPPEMTGSKWLRELFN